MQRHAGEGGDHGDGQRQRGNDGGGDLAQEDEDHPHHQQRRRSAAWSARRRPRRGSSGCGRSSTSSLTAGGRMAWNCGRIALILSITSMVLEPGWRMIASAMARSFLYQLPAVGIFQPVDHVGDIAEPHRRAVLVGDDLVAELGGIVELAVGMDDAGAAWRRSARRWPG